MDATILRRIGWVTVSLGLTTLLVGCGELTGDLEGSGTSTDGAARAANNGLALINGLALVNGLAGVNGLANTNGLALSNGLAMTNGLSSTTGLMTTAAGRRTVSYLVRCALAAGDTLVKADQNGTSYTFAGSIGLCPAWKSSAVTQSWSCQEMVSACMMAHLNTAGIHIPIWLDADTSTIGWGTSTAYPAQEGSFFGNILTTGLVAHGAAVGPKAYYCDGDGFATGSSGVVAGRIGAGQSGAPYVNPFGNGVLCKNSLHVVPSDSKTNPDGYKQFMDSTGNAWNAAITVWRNASYTPSFDADYRYTLAGLNSSSKEMVRAPTTSTTVDQQAASTLDTQLFAILASGSSWKVALKSDTSKCLDAGAATAGTAVTVASCSGGTQQAWSVTPDVQTGSFVFKNAKGATCLNVRGSSSSAGALIEVATCASGTTSQHFVIKGQ